MSTHIQFVLLFRWPSPIRQVDWTADVMNLGRGDTKASKSISNFCPIVRCSLLYM